MADVLDSIRQWLREMDQAAYEASQRYLGPHATNAIQRANDAARVFSSAGAAQSAGEQAQESYDAFSRGDPLQGTVSALGSAADVMSTAPGAAMLPKLAILLGLGGARRLAMERMRGPDAWGGSRTYYTAEQALKGGMDPRKAWEKYGWSDSAYGQRVPMYTAISDEPMSLRTQGPYTSGPFERVVDHPELLAAAPGLRNIPTRVIIDPSTGHAQGRTRYRVNRLTRGVDSNPELIEAAAPEPDLALSTMLHEAQHGAAGLDDLPFGAPLKGMDASKFRYDTPAAQRAREEFELLRDAHNVDPATDVWTWPDEVQDAFYNYQRKGDFGRYINDPGEMIARGEEVVHARGLPLETPRQLDYIDPYDLSPFMRDPAYNFSQYRPFGK